MKVAGCYRQKQLTRRQSIYTRTGSRRCTHQNQNSEEHSCKTRFHTERWALAAVIADGFVTTDFYLVSARSAPFLESQRVLGLTGMGGSATVNELLAGSAAGAAQVLVGQPFDTVKTRAQIAPSSFSSYLTFATRVLTSWDLACRGNVCEPVIHHDALPSLDPPMNKERADRYPDTDDAQGGLLRVV
jgi:hypothetical protein